MYKVSITAALLDPDFDKLFLFVVRIHSYCPRLESFIEIKRVIISNGSTIQLVKNQSFPGRTGPLGGVDLHFCSPQPDISLHCRGL